MNEFFQNVKNFFAEPLYMWIGIAVGALLLIGILLLIIFGVRRSNRKKAAKRAAKALTAQAPAQTKTAPASEPAASAKIENTETDAGSEETETINPIEESTAIAEEEPDSSGDKQSPEKSNARNKAPDSVEQSELEISPAEKDTEPGEIAAPVPNQNEEAEASDAGNEKPAKKPAAKKPASAKPAVKKPAKPVETVKKASINTSRGGKWVVTKQREDEFVACLYANNGELLLESEIYSNPQGAKNGIDTIKKNILLGNFGMHRDKNGNYFYKLKSGTNRLLCVGEVYTTKASCESAIESVKRFSMRAPTATEIEEDLSVIEYVPKDTAIFEAKAGHTGKWQIKQLDENAYVACLYANNGELLLASEDYATVAGAKGAIESIKKNAFDNNFIIDRNKAGKFCYKLRNAVKSTVCVGEVYEKQSAVEQTIESVKRFCQTAVLDEADSKKGVSKEK